MKHLITLLALAGLALSVHAAEPAKAAPAAKPAATAKAAKEAKAEREPAKVASTREPSAKQKAQQEKMKACNASAKGKAGDERKAFMKECLRAKA